MTGRVDIGLIYNPVPSAAIETTPLLDEDLLLICPPKEGDRRQSKRVSLHDLPRYPLIIQSPANALRLHIETELAKLGIKPTIAMEIDGVALILDLVRDGHGYSVLPINCVRCDPRNRKLLTVPIVRPRLASLLTVAISAQHPKTTLMDDTLQLIYRMGPKILSAP